MRKALPAAVGVLALTIAGCTTGSSGSSGPSGLPSSGGSSSGASVGSRPSPQHALSWQPCPGVGQGLRCASLRVPLDYGSPGGRKITLALSEVPATAPAGRRQGVLLVNPGGPGGTGRGLAAFVAASLDPAVAADYTIVGFD